MWLKLRKMELKNFVMILGFVCSVAKNMIDSSDLFGEFSLVTDIFLGIFFLSMMYKLATQRYTLKRIFVMLLLLSIAVLSAYHIKYYSLLYSVIFLLCMEDVSLDLILKASFITKFVLLFTHVVIYLISYVFFTESIVFTYRNGIERQNFFMNHPNTFTAYLTWTSMELLYLLYRKIKVWQLLGIWGINFIFYQFTNSNSGILILTFTIFCITLKVLHLEKGNGILSFISAFGFPFFSVFFLFLAKIYPSLSGGLKQIWDYFDSFMTGRLLYGAYALDTVGITWFGKNFRFPEKSYWNGHWQDKIMFDNMYFHLYFYIGAIFLVLISLFFLLISRKTSDLEKIFISSTILYGVMENYIINIFIVFPLLFIGVHCFQQNGLPLLTEIFSSQEEMNES